MHAQPDAEITLEANPGTFEAHKFAEFRALGINRLSIGIQSFDPQHLRSLGRIHDERERDMDATGVLGSLNFPSMSGFAGQLWAKHDDKEVSIALLRAYNGWLAEFGSYAADKMAGLALISLYDPEAGARELERCAKMGLKGAMIWCSPPQEQPYSSDVYDPFWAAAQEMKMPISLHAITGMGIESQWNWGERYMRTTVLGYEVEK